MKDSTTTQRTDVSTVASPGSYVNRTESHTIDLYSAIYGTRDNARDTTNKTVPFTHPITLKNPDGTSTQVHALFDDGAMTGAMALSTFTKIKSTLKGWKPSTQTLRMANGVVVPSEATWTGTINIEGVEAAGTFEVFDSAGGWSFLFGKPLLKTFRAVHDYTMDEVTISDDNTTVTLHNYSADNPPLRTSAMCNNTTHEPAKNENTRKEKTSSQEDVFTRKTDPFKPERVKYIVKNIQVGNDLTASEREEITKLLTEFADVFACSLSEVLPIPGAQIDLNIPDDTTFRTTVHQRPMNPPQCQFMNKWVDQMLDADLIEHANIPRIKHVAPTVLTQKAHNTGDALTLEDLQRAVNKQCQEANIPCPFQQQNDTLDEETKEPKGPNEAPKWRVMQNFAELNKATRIPPMFQGDIRAKQQRLSGHRKMAPILHILRRRKRISMVQVDGNGVDGSPNCILCHSNTMPTRRNDRRHDGTLG